MHSSHEQHHDDTSHANRKRMPNSRTKPSGAIGPVLVVRSARITVLALLKLKDARVRERLVPEELRISGVRRARMRGHELGKRAIRVAVHCAHGDDVWPELVRDLVPRRECDRVVERVFDCGAVAGREVPGGVAEVLAEFGVGLPCACAWRGGVHKKGGSGMLGVDVRTIIAARLYAR